MIVFEKIFTVSNLLSFVRILLAVPLWFLLDNFEANKYIVIALCLFAGITDLLDGYLARKLNQVTEFGKVIDPLADKVCIAALFIKLFLIQKIDLLFFTFVISRDVLIILASLLLSSKLNKVLPSNYLGKATALIISLFVLIILFGFEAKSLVYLCFYYLGLVLIVVSLINYIFIGMKAIRKNGIV
jgi:CDP-diacylglycerol--glycerol-3-phosphate 3-phosphatidyltransferase